MPPTPIPDALKLDMPSDWVGPTTRDMLRIHSDSNSSTSSNSGSDMDGGGTNLGGDCQPAEPSPNDLISQNEEVSAWNSGTEQFVITFHVDSVDINAPVVVEDYESPPPIPGDLVRLERSIDVELIWNLSMGKAVNMDAGRRPFFQKVLINNLVARLHCERPHL
ncbi:hypothetical protein HDU83_000207 [Entophlyctis luteolus]|nr:hypothetical protein HDU83_000207 [Entophlyctis luteolus]